ncbi:hypothetical protein EC973_000392 [Apophysomyces ossiformis]|uniref:Ribosome assembly protein 3 n=1 Tax=Apophysomyces ossiformis TaxID=679940 RepID=A0A8H7ESM8_9FUNG|nr:hypothetical protein EC973_000392 [Apophysomyces ossiformis]
MEQLEDGGSDLEESVTTPDNENVNEPEINENKEEEDDKQKEEEEKEGETQTTKKQFRNHYMSQITQAFGTDLDKIRQEPNFNAVRLNVLIDSLEAGIDIFSDLEQEIILADVQARNG